MNFREILIGTTVLALPLPIMSVFLYVMDVKKVATKVLIKHNFLGMSFSSSGSSGKQTEN